MSAERIRVLRGVWLRRFQRQAQHRERQRERQQGIVAKGTAKPTLCVSPQAAGNDLGNAVAAKEVPDGPSWANVLVVVLAVGVTGTIVYLLMRRRPDPVPANLGSPQLPASAPPPMYLLNAGTEQAPYAASMPQAAPSIAYDDSRSLAVLGRIESKIVAGNRGAQRIPTPSVLKTYRLPWLGDPSNEAQAIRIATSLTNPYEVEVRVVGPPGALAALSFAATELSNQSLIKPTLSDVPTGDVIVVPAGSPQRIYMNPRHILYARGNLSAAALGGSVILSVSSNDVYAAR